MRSSTGGVLQARAARNFILAMKLRSSFCVDFHPEGAVGLPSTGRTEREIGGLLAIGDAIGTSTAQLLTLRLASMNLRARVCAASFVRRHIERERAGPGRKRQSEEN
jgi:hypothetical protein